MDDKVKRQILENKLQLWRNTQYGAEVDARVAKAIGDEVMLEQAKRNIGRAIQAQDAVEALLEELGIED